MIFWEFNPKIFLRVNVILNILVFMLVGLIFIVIRLVNMIWELLLLWLDIIIMLWVSENKLWEVFNIRGIC
jgi:hypothetical protein